MTKKHKPDTAWGYRIFKQKGRDGNWIYFIGEAIYEDGEYQGGYVPLEDLSGPSVEYIKRDLQQIAKVFKQSVLEAGDDGEP